MMWKIEVRSVLVVNRVLAVRFPDSDTWKTIKGGESFNVPANSKFKVKAKTVVDYCCSYL